MELDAISPQNILALLVQNVAHDLSLWIHSQIDLGAMGAPPEAKPLVVQTGCCASHCATNAIPKPCHGNSSHCATNASSKTCYDTNSHSATNASSKPCHGTSSHSAAQKHDQYVQSGEIRARRRRAVGRRSTPQAQHISRAHAKLHIVLFPRPTALRHE